MGDASTPRLFLRIPQHKKSTAASEARPKVPSRTRLARPKGQGFHQMVRFSFFKGPHAKRCHTGMVMKDPLFGFYLGPFPRCDKKADKVPLFAKRFQGNSTGPLQIRELASVSAQDFRHFDKLRTALEPHSYGKAPFLLPHHVRLKSLKSSGVVTSIIQGRPWGQVKGCSVLRSSKITSLICRIFRSSPARMAL